MQSLGLPENIIDITRSIIPKITSASYVEKVILFGSYSKGTYTDDSDVDVAVFVKENSVSIMDEYKRLLRLCMQYDMDIQPQVFFMSELDDPIGIVEEIVMYGKEITHIF